MRKPISLFWKTWLTTVSALFVTLIIFFIIFSIFTSHFVEDFQKKQFLKNVDIITSSIEIKGIDKELLKQFSARNYLILIEKDDELIYPNQVDNSDFFFSTETDEDTPTVEMIEDGDAPSVFSNPNATSVIITSEVNESTANNMEVTQSVIYQKETYSVAVIYPLTINSSDTKKMLASTLPYFLGIGFFVTFIISSIYARYFSKRVIQLDKTVIQMSNGEQLPQHIEKKGDELKNLENNLFKMYSELQHTLHQLKIEVETVKRLEADRQLFMRGATHELKTPIMAMNSIFLELLEIKDETSEEHQKILICYTRLQKMKRLVNEILDISKTELIVYQGKTDILKSTDEICAAYNYMLNDKSLTLILDIQKDTTIQLPDKIFKKIISNLIGNAVKHSSENGKITIKSGEKFWEINNNYNYTETLDENLLYEPFVSINHSDDKTTYESGHGLGLYIVSNILKQTDISYMCSTANQQFFFKIYWE